MKKKFEIIWMMLLLDCRKYGSYYIFLLSKLLVKIIWSIFICR